MSEISIIVPVYKVERYLVRCIDSILNQTFRDLEVILIDDGSSDHSSEICDDYSRKDNRIIVIHQKNKGVSAARNAGLDLAKGEYIGFVDSDDWVEPNMYEGLFNYIKSKEVDISICGINRYNASGVCVGTDFAGDSLFTKELLLKDLYGKPTKAGGVVWNKLFSRSVVQGIRFSPQIKMAEDIVFLFKCYTKTTCAYHGNMTGYNVFEREESATRLNEAEAYYDIIFDGKFYLLLMARDYSQELEKVAVDKYMDDCIRFSCIIREYGKRTHTPYRLKVLRIRFQILKLMPRTIIKQLLPKEKIHGYVYAIIKQ